MAIASDGALKPSFGEGIVGIHGIRMADCDEHPAYCSEVHATAFPEARQPSGFRFA